MKGHRKKWFEFVKSILKVFVRKPKFTYLGEKVTQPSIILSNHEGAFAPVKWELYFDMPFRFWGTAEMNMGLKSTFKYLKNIYFPQKRHIPRFFSAIFAFFASPFVNLFYKGLSLISTYNDVRLKSTISESMRALSNGESIIIFPEDSSDGYHQHLKKFFSGFVVFGKKCLASGIDLPVFASFYDKKSKQFLIDKPIMFSKLESSGLSRDQIAQLMCERTNELSNQLIKKEENKKSHEVVAQ